MGSIPTSSKDKDQTSPNSKYASDANRANASHDSTKGAFDLDSLRNLKQNDMDRKLMYYSALGASVACPIVALMPPRKFDLFTFGLGITFFVSAGHVVQERTGQGLLWHIGSALPTAKSKEQIESVHGQDKHLATSGHTEQARGFWRSLWMGNESNDWIQERARKEKEALEDGRGYSGLIGEHIMQAFGYEEKNPSNESE